MNSYVLIDKEALLRLYRDERRTAVFRRFFLTPIKYQMI